MELAGSFTTESITWLHSMGGQMSFLAGTEARFNATKAAFSLGISP